MIYVLTTPQGRVFEFYVRSCAELYHGMYGGTLVENHSISSIREMCSTLADCEQLELL
jgi:hypothetical protein